MSHLLIEKSFKYKERKLPNLSGKMKIIIYFIFLLFLSIYTSGCATYEVWNEFGVTVHIPDRKSLKVRKITNCEFQYSCNDTVKTNYFLFSNKKKENITGHLNKLYIKKHAKNLEYDGIETELSEDIIQQKGYLTLYYDVADYDEHPEIMCVIWNYRSYASPYIYIPESIKKYTEKYAAGSTRKCEHIAYTEIPIPISLEKETKLWIYPTRVLLTPFSITADIITFPFLFVYSLAIYSSLRHI